MKSILAALCLATFAVACGGAPGDVEPGDQSAADMKLNPSEPVTWVSMAKSAAAKYARNPRLMNLAGEVGPTDGFGWTFTFAGDRSIWVTVECDGRAAKVTSHGEREFMMGVAAVNLKEVRVTFAKLEKIAAREGLSGRILHAELAEALAPKAHPHWDLTQGGHELFVDAYTGAVLE